MASTSRGVHELNELIERLDNLILTLVDQTDDSPDEAHDVRPAENVETARGAGVIADPRVSVIEKEIRRKLMEIHSRLKNNANYLNFGDEESFFDETEQETEEAESRVARRRKASQQQQQQRQEEEVDNNDSDMDSTRPPQPLPMSSVNSSASAAGVLKPGILNSDRGAAVVKLCLAVFGHETEGTSGEKKQLRFTDESKALAAQLIAEIARTDLGRRLALQLGVVGALQYVLGDEEPLDNEEGGVERRHRKTECSTETAVQVCRILGNLCFESIDGRKQVLQHQKLLEKLYTITRYRDKRAGEDPGQRLPVILPGFLLNFCSSTPDAVQAVGRLGFVDIVVSNILTTRTNDAVFNSSLNFFICLSEELESAREHLINSEHFPEALTHILEFTTSPEVTQTVLELIRAIVDCPKVSLHLTRKTKLFETFLNHIVGKWQGSSEFEPLRSDACELLVVLLSHDDTMKEIFGDGNSIKTFAAWLTRSDDPPLQVAAALSLGNFACNEEIGLSLLEAKDDNVVDRMIELLNERQNPVNDFKLQHAILGALRNFSVTVSARQSLIERGIIAPCLTLIERLNLSSPAYHAVTFKLLGTLRLLVDGHPEAVMAIVQSGGTEDVVSKFVTWSLSPDAPQGIRAESGRLLAALVKNCRSKQIFRSIIFSGGLPPVTQMLHSSHVRMVNEALIALTVLAATLVGQVSNEGDINDDALLVHRQLHIDLVINGIKKCLRDEDHSTPIPPEVKLNAVALTENLLKVQTEEFKQMLNDLNFVEDCLSDEALKLLPEGCRTLAEKIKAHS